ncbi:hypothetical protein B0H12DRAFT_569693 [Mycena haematopus]|nr:hypothetical protein B0H12DRAFT_569693 [Mycena haematopus]
MYMLDEQRKPHPTMVISSVRLPDRRDTYKPEQRDVDGVASSGDRSSTADSEDADQSIGPFDSPPGVHRFIGVIAVAVLIVMVLSLWLMRRKIRILLLGRSRPSSASAIQEGDKNLASENTQRNPTRNIKQFKKNEESGPRTFEARSYESKFTTTKTVRQRRCSCYSPRLRQLLTVALVVVSHVSE